jgi:hypothetical protein
VLKLAAMDNFNKVLSFILGLVVVVVFIIVLSSRLDLGKKFLPFQSGTPTPKVTPTAKKPTPTPTIGFYSGQGGAVGPTKAQTKGGQVQIEKPTSIPSTGSPTEALLILNSGLLLGFYLRKKTA